MPPPDTLPAAPAEQAAPMAQALALVATDLRTASQS
jgi:hypothetical protein